MKPGKMTLSKQSGTMVIGRRHFTVDGKTYKVGDIIKGVRLYVSEKEYFETDGRVASTNIRKQSVSFKGVAPLIKKNEE